MQLEVEKYAQESVEDKEDKEEKDAQKSQKIMYRRAGRRAPVERMV